MACKVLLGDSIRFEDTLVPRPSTEEVEAKKAARVKNIVKPNVFIADAFLTTE